MVTPTGTRHELLVRNNVPVLPVSLDGLIATPPLAECVTATISHDPTPAQAMFVQACRDFGFATMPGEAISDEQHVVRIPVEAEAHAEPSREHGGEVLDTSPDHWRTHTPKLLRCPVCEKSKIQKAPSDALRERLNPN